MMAVRAWIAGAVVGQTDSPIEAATCGRGAAMGSVVHPAKPMRPSKQIPYHFMGRKTWPFALINQALSDFLRFRRKKYFPLCPGKGPVYSQRMANDFTHGM